MHNRLPKCLHLSSKLHISSSCNDLEIILEKKPYNVALESQVIHKSIPKNLLILEEMLQLEERCNICSFFINTLIKDL
jgi:hypothetical protein